MFKVGDSVSNGHVLAHVVAVHEKWVWCMPLGKKRKEGPLTFPFSALKKV